MVIEYARQPDCGSARHGCRGKLAVLLPRKRGDEARYEVQENIDRTGMEEEEEWIKEPNL